MSFTKAGEESTGILAAAVRMAAIQSGEGRRRSRKKISLLLEPSPRTASLPRCHLEAKPADRLSGSRRERAKLGLLLVRMEPCRHAVGSVSRPRVTNLDRVCMVRGLQPVCTEFFFPTNLGGFQEKDQINTVFLFFFFLLFGTVAVEDPFGLGSLAVHAFQTAKRCFFYKKFSFKNLLEKINLFFLKK